MVDTTPQVPWWLTLVAAGVTGVFALVVAIVGHLLSTHAAKVHREEERNERTTSYWREQRLTVAAQFLAELEQLALDAEHLFLPNPRGGHLVPTDQVIAASGRVHVTAARVSLAFAGPVVAAVEQLTHDATFVVSAVEAYQYQIEVGEGGNPDEQAETAWANVDHAIGDLRTRQSALRDLIRDSLGLPKAPR